MHNRRTRASGPVHGCCVIHILLLYSIILSHKRDCQGTVLYISELKILFEYHFEDIRLEQDPASEIGKP